MSCLLHYCPRRQRRPAAGGGTLVPAAAGGQRRCQTLGARMPPLAVMLSTAFSTALSAPPARRAK